jgi:peptide/nickel transport system substrate-binding protein
MVVRHNKIRYTYWIIIAFLKKNIHLIFLSFIASLVAVIVFISFSPQLMATEKRVIGMVGTYDYNTLPEEILSKISNSMLHIDKAGEIKQVLCKSWQTLDNGKEYRFKLRQDLTWTDGSKFKAQDVNYSFRDVKVEAIDDYTLSLKLLKKPLAIFPTFLTNPIIKPPLSGVAGLYDVSRVDTEFGNITEIDLTPNESGYPVYQYKFFDTETKLIDAYKLGEINSMKTNNRKIANIFDSWNNTTIQTSVDYTQLLTLFFNTEASVLQEKDFRQAIAHSISKKIYTDHGEEAIGPIPPTSWAYYSDLKRIQTNKQLAKKIVDKFKEGSEKPITLTISTFYDYLPVAEKLQQMLKDIGIDARVNIFSLNNEASFDILLAFWNVPEDPDQYYFWHSTQKEGNITRLKNVKIDKLLEDGRGTLSVKERKDIYEDFQKVMMDEVPAHFLYYPYTYNIQRKSSM